MFPKINPLPPILEDEITAEEKKGYFLKIDYVNNRLFLENGRPIKLEGYEALKERIRKIIFTQKDKFIIYRKKIGVYEDYGNPILKYIGKNLPSDFLEAESEWWIKDIFSEEKEILEIKNITAYMKDDNLKVEYKLKTIYGYKEGEIDV
ncbi:MAG: DUF2634 domain-containing protein [Cetobacterium sp.]